MSSLWLVKKTAVAASEGDCGGGLNQFFFWLDLLVVHNCRSGWVVVVY